MITVSILGGGQIGSRHLQALALVKEPLQIFVVEPSAGARHLCSERFSEIKSSKDHHLELCERLSELPKENEIAIIATSSAIRRSVIEEFLDARHCRYMILEKFLFPAMRDYSVIGKLLTDKHILSWVNCNWRAMPVFQWIKSSLNTSSPTTVTVDGVRWGLGTNSVHFIDLFLFWTNASTCTAAEVALDSEILQSKRSGYVEFTGRLELISEKKDRIVLEARASGDGPIIMTVRNGYVIWQIIRLLDRVVVSRLDRPDFRAVSIKTALQSEMTNLLVEELFLTGQSSLPGWEIAAKYHQTLLKVFLDFLRSKNRESEECLIT